MTNCNKNTAILRIHCPDQQGIIARVTDFIWSKNGNIVALDQHANNVEKRFFMRVEWDMNGFTMDEETLPGAFQQEIGTPFQMEWKLNFSRKAPRMAVFVSRHAHCLYDLLARYRSNELAVEIPLIISNHNDMAPVAEQFGIDFHHIPVQGLNKKEQEEKQLALIRKYDIDFIVLARYMQILSADFIDHFPNKIINIHHSSLPAFAGAKPYHAAHARGVKIIGATSHYVTNDLDEGPIIEQDIIRVSHHDDVNSLVQKGKDIEKVVLARAVKAHIDRKTLVYKNRTVIFA
ncbi:formyltetrahydrofolate deformylase [Marinilabiliaceae bacterium JC017]|nr:formyltetrahydrofolate deformylase [Marinilabiliaceae bacterium JC017]